MNDREKKELQRIVQLAIEVVQEKIAHGPYDEIAKAMHEVKAWRFACYEGAREALVDAGDPQGATLDLDSMVTNFRVRDLMTTVMASVSIGMDFAIEMHRLGAKFPDWRVN